MDSRIATPSAAGPSPFPEGAISLEPATITRARFTSVADVVETVRRWGIIVFPGFVGGAQLAALNREFDTMIAARSQLQAQVDEMENLINVRLPREAYAEVFPTTAAFFGQPLMQEIAAAYYAPEPFKLNYQVYVSLLSETKGAQAKPPFALHFDKRPCLKFFVYLSDTDARNGAMRATPGSILRNGPQRERDTARLADMEEIENIVPEPTEPSVPITGPAGTMFVFHTDMNHGASSVQPGLTRRTMRGHTQPLSLLRKMGYRV